MKTKRLRLMPILMAIMMAFTMMLMIGGAVYAGTNEEIIDGVKYELLEDNTVRVVGYTEELPANVVLPNSVRDYPVTSVAYGAFEDSTKLESITIPASMTNIGGATFKNSGLSSVTFEAGSGLTEIGYGVFEGCSKLTSITIPKTVTKIDYYAFKDSGLQFATFEAGSGLTEIGYGAFWGSALQSIVIPSGVTNIGYDAFNCDNLFYAFYAGTENQWNNMSDRNKNWTGGRDVRVVFPKVKTPTGKTFTYNGKSNTGVAEGLFYSLSGTIKATKAGTYTAKATLVKFPDPNFTFVWADGTTAAKSIKWQINKAGNTLKIKAKTATVKGSTKGKNGKLKKNKTLAVGKVIAFTKKGQGKMTYTKATGNKKITINKKTGKVTVKKGLKKGTYKVKVKVKAAGNANYKASAVKTVTFKVRVK